MGAGGGGSCIDRRRLLSCAPAARASPFAAPPSSRTEAPSPRPGPRATTDRIDHRHGGGEGRKGMLRCERDPQNAARRRVHTRAPCYRPRHTISVAAPVNESGDLYPLAREPPRLDSPGLSLKTIRRPLLLSLSLVGERVQRPTRIHTPNPSPPGATRRYRLPLPRLLSPSYTCVHVYARIGFFACRCEDPSIFLWLYFLFSRERPRKGTIGWKEDALDAKEVRK